MPGNPTAKTFLSTLLEKQTLPSVLLFHGPQDSGKELFAEALAHHLVAHPKKEHPDIHILLPEGKTKQHPISSIRSLLEEANLAPFEAPCKVFLIHDAEEMLPSSSNALLKILEEPPQETYFILLSSDPIKLLPTIASRCRKMAFFSLPMSHPTDRYHTLLNHLFSCKEYPQLLHSLSKIEEDEPADDLFKELLHFVRDHHPLKLEHAFSLVHHCRTALAHHIKLKHVLEYFFLKQGSLSGGLKLS